MSPYSTLSASQNSFGSVTCPFLVTLTGFRSDGMVVVCKE